jgi:hypothetical protein
VTRPEDGRSAGAARLDAGEWADLPAGLERFNEAADGEPADAELWAMGWTT